MTTYRIEIRGELDAHFAKMFWGWSVSHADGGTVMTGDVADGDGLQRMLDRFADLGIEVVRVQGLNLEQPGREPLSQR